MKKTNEHKYVSLENTLNNHLLTIFIYFHKKKEEVSGKMEFF